MPDAQTPPWGDDADFDAARAWALIQSLRTEVTDEKAKTTTERQARQAAEAAVADADPEGKIKALTTRAETAEQKLAVTTVLVDFPALKGFEDFLTGSTPEEIKAQAERLAARVSPTTPEGDAKGEPGDATPVVEGETPPVPQSQTPTPALTPGHGGADSTPFDPTAIAKSVRR
jgi:hypothetical protein